MTVAFTADDAQRAHDEWGSNCGPGALAAITGKTLDQVRPHLEGFDDKGYTNPTMMWGALNSMKIRWSRRRKHQLNWPHYGLCRIQWGGPWTEPGVPARVAYRHTHWVGAEAADDLSYVRIFDINAMSVGGWISLQEWGQQLVPWLLEQCEPKASGLWWITHVADVERGR